MVIRLDDSGAIEISVHRKCEGCAGNVYTQGAAWTKGPEVIDFTVLHALCMSVCVSVTPSAVYNVVSALKYKGRMGKLKIMNGPRSQRAYTRLRRGANMPARLFRFTFLSLLFHSLFYVIKMFLRRKTSEQ